ncbi:phosphatase PAP2 family protein [Cellulomonas rhizosphaerae]|uniref:phosphatase PAP2 family protein n=1 Tax=Cellulomonas rhizosphaerae TaxID=2293719 RepID=UPI0013146D4D|nr:phosphatase PAP2 family protein [Cellulomonas rhizosphaerae]
MTAGPGTVEKQRPRVMSRARSALLAREAAIMVAVYVVYSIIRNHAPNKVRVANAHSRDILNVEKALGLDIEHGINHFFAQHTAIITVANYMYATLFLPSAIFVLAWLWRRSSAQYVVHRSVLVVMTMFALVSYWVFPAAPPRLLPGGGYIDTVVVFETWGRSAADSGHGVSNEYAAMPSMHFGWALWCGLAVFAVSKVRWQKVLAIAFPSVTLVVIIATGNHFLFDAIAGAAVYGVAYGAVRVVRRLSVREPAEELPLAA